MSIILATIRITGQVHLAPNCLRLRHVAVCQFTSCSNGRLARSLVPDKALELCQLLTRFLRMIGVFVNEQVSHRQPRVWSTRNCEHGTAAGVSCCTGKVNNLELSSVIEEDVAVYNRARTRCICIVCCKLVVRDVTVM